MIADLYVYHFINCVFKWFMGKTGLHCTGYTRADWQFKKKVYFIVILAARLTILNYVQEIHEF